MDGAPPIVAFEQPESPTPRYPFGWVTLVVVFVTLIVLQLIEPPQSNPTSEIKAGRAHISSELQSRALTGQLNQPSKNASAEIGFRKWIDSSGKIKTPSPILCRVRLGSQALLGTSLDPAWRARLANKADADDRLFLSLISDAGTVAPKELARARKMKDPEWKAALVYYARRTSDQDLERSVLGKGVSPALLTAIGAFTLMGLAGMGLWLLYALQRGQNKLLPLTPPITPLSLGEADRVAFIMALLVATYFLVPTMISMGLANLIPKGASTIIAVLAFLGASLYALNQTPFPVKRITGQFRPSNILWGLGGYCANIPILAIAVIVGSVVFRGFATNPHPAITSLQSREDIWSIVSIYVLACVHAPIFEEITFRGMLMPALAKVTKSTAAGILISSLMFASIHPQGLPTWLALAAIGAMNSVLTWQTRSLFPAMILHACHNGILLTITLMTSPLS